MGFRSQASLLKTLKEDEEEGVVRPLSIIPEAHYYESENDVEDVVNVTLTRVPKFLDLEVHSLDMKNFTEAFNNNTLPNKPMTALGLQTHDAIYIGGCWLGFAAVADNWVSIERVSCQTL